MSIEFFKFLAFGILGGLVFELFLIGFLKLIGFIVVVPEGKCFVYVLFGKVACVLKEPGLHLLWFKIGWKAPLMRFFGNNYWLDMRLDQEYLRSQPVNSEEGAPMGIGVWYEMFISDPVSFLFKNADPRGSLSANVSNATVRCLSNMPLSDMLQDRHKMSQITRSEVSTKSDEWGYRLGSVYIRKVHFRDGEMIRQIESKVVNRLRQVTAGITQHGENQVRIITSEAQKSAAAEFAKASAVRPKIIGEALQKISVDSDVSKALFEVLQCQRIIEGGGQITILPPDSGVIPDLLAAKA